MHEFFEDVGEMFDGNPNNDSFTDGGNGSGDETPTPLQPGYSNGGGIPVLITMDGFTYSFLNGGFSLIGGGGGPGGGGDDGIIGV